MKPPRQRTGGRSRRLDKELRIELPLQEPLSRTHGMRRKRIGEEEEPLAPVTQTPVMPSSPSSCAKLPPTLPERKTPLLSLHPPAAAAAAPSPLTKSIAGAGARRLAWRRQRSVAFPPQIHPKSPFPSSYAEGPLLPEKVSPSVLPSLASTQGAERKLRMKGRGGGKASSEGRTVSIPLPLSPSPPSMTSRS